MIVNYKEFNEWWLKRIPAAKRKPGNQGTKIRTVYKDIITAFDIETTRIKSIEQSVMYVWQWQFDTEYTVVGRTWDEFLRFINVIKPFMNGQHLVVYVHNLSYEFQFLRGIYDFKPEEVFALSSRKILKCDMFDFLEFRCSYLHTNMSLKEFTEKMGAEHSKLSGDEFDYSKERYSWTPLTDRELAYCVNDVLGLVEAIKIEMAAENMNLYELPLTSTGFVRKDTKKAMSRISHYYVKKQLPTFNIYEMLREAFRGGNTHANRFYAGQILNNVNSADRSSSYPEVLENHLFPVDEFFNVGEQSLEQLQDLIVRRHKAVLMRIRLYNLKLKDDTWGCPYLSRDRCRNILGGVYDNGRILSAEFLETTITDIDLRIILDEYCFEDFEAFDVCFARYGKLPPPFLKLINKYYDMKTRLKGNEEEELAYFRAKQKINSLYGMCAQDPVKQSIVFENGLFTEKNEDPEKLLEKYNHKAFLCYQWGVWVTAWSRWELEQGIKLAGENFVYCDTDSVKYLGEIDWEPYNKAKEKASTASGAFAVDSKGATHYMGVFEYEGCYKRFVTLGAKKYCYEDNKGGLHITVAGVIKAKGGSELAAHGGISAFKPDFVFREAGGVEAVYNDFPEIDSITIDGHVQPITANVVLRESEYTLGITDEYEALLMKCGLTS